MHGQPVIASRFLHETKHVCWILVTELDASASVDDGTQVYRTHISSYVQNVTAERELTIANTIQQRRFKEADGPL